MLLINCEIKFFLTWSEECIIVTRDYDDKKPKFPITETKIYVSVVTSSTQDNEKLLQQLKAGFNLELISIRTNITNMKSIFKPLNWSKFSESK